MKKIIIDTIPSGLKYGFPKELPQNAVIHYGSNDYGIREDFDVVKWIEKQGYPLDIYRKYTWRTKDYFDPDIHGGGVESFGTYYYPGSDPQQ